MFRGNTRKAQRRSTESPRASHRLIRNDRNDERASKHLAPASTYIITQERALHRLKSTAISAHRRPLNHDSHATGHARNHAHALRAASTTLPRLPRTATSGGIQPLRKARRNAVCRCRDGEGRRSQLATPQEHARSNVPAQEPLLGLLVHTAVEPLDAWDKRDKHTHQAFRL